MMRWSGSGWQRVALLGLGFVGLVVLTVMWNKAPTFYKYAKDPGGAVATTRTGILTAVAGLIAFTGVMLNVAETRRANEQARKRDRLTHEREQAAHLDG